MISETQNVKQLDWLIVCISAVHAKVNSALHSRFFLSSHTVRMLMSCRHNLYDICAGDTCSYQATACTGAVSLHWSVPALLNLRKSDTVTRSLLKDLSVNSNACCSGTCGWLEPKALGSNHFRSDRSCCLWGTTGHMELNRDINSGHNTSATTPCIGTPCWLRA